MNKAFRNTIVAFFLFASALFSARHAEAAITSFELSAKDISSSSAFFDFTVTGEGRDDIAEGYRGSYALMIFSPYGRGSTSYIRAIRPEIPAVPPESATLSVSDIQVTELLPGKEYFAVILQNSDNNWSTRGSFSNFVRFRTGPAGTSGSVVETIPVAGATRGEGARIIASIEDQQDANQDTFYDLVNMRVSLVQADPAAQSATVAIEITTDSAERLDSPGNTEFKAQIYDKDPRSTPLNEIIPHFTISLDDANFDYARRTQTLTVTFRPVEGRFHGVTADKTWYIGARRTEAILQDKDLASNVIEIRNGEQTDDITDPLIKPRDQIPECFSFTNKLNPAGCVAQFVNVFVGISSYAAGAAAGFLDAFIEYSISSESYTVSTFVERGWSIVRDFANIVFIFVLVFAALATILDLAWINTKQVIGKVIMVAIFINFSLFLTRVVVDVGNITARVFYNAVEVADTRDAADRTGDAKSLTVAVAERIQPQKLMGQEIFNADGTLWYFILVQIAIVGVNLWLIYLFVSIAFLFVGRTVGLMIAMIFSPLAFVSTTVPQLKSALGEIGWDKWWGNLARLAFMAPIFLFFMYLIIAFIDSQALTSLGASAADAGLLSKLITFFIPLAIIVVLLQKAKDITMKMAGDIGEKINKWAGNVTGFAAGAATGGLGMLGSRTLGMAASKMLRGGTGFALSQAEAKGGVQGYAARLALKTLESGAKSSFDLRKTALGSLVDKTGLNLEKGTSAIGLSMKDTAASGYDTLRKKEEKERLERAEALKVKLSDDALIERNKDEYERKLVEARRDAESKGKILDEKKFKETFAREERETINEKTLRTYGENLQRAALSRSIFNRRFGAGFEGSVAAGKKLQKSPLTAALGDELDAADKALARSETKLTEVNNRIASLKEDYVLSLATEDKEAIRRLRSRESAGGTLTADELRTLKMANIQAKRASKTALSQDEITLLNEATEKIGEDKLHEVVEYMTNQKLGEQASHETTVSKIQARAASRPMTQADWDEQANARQKAAQLRKEIDRMGRIISERDQYERDRQRNERNKENLMNKSKSDE